MNISYALFFFLVIEGTVLSEMVECPTDIIAKWNYVVTDSNGNSYCTVNSSLDICQNTTLIFNTSQCSGNLLHSGNLVYPRYNVSYFDFLACIQFITNYSSLTTCLFRLSESLTKCQNLPF